MRILHLTLKKKWFDLIASGKKKIEYRVFKPYWEKRLLDENGMIYRFDEVHFKNGYDKNAPFMRVDFGGGFVTHSDLCYPENGEELSNGLYFLLCLGSVLELRV